MVSSNAKQPERDMAQEAAHHVDSRSHTTSDPEGSCLCPVDLCRCMPLSVRVLVPGHFQVVYDWTHAALVCALGSACALLFLGAVTILTNRSCSPGGCFRDVCVFLATTSCFSFILRTLHTYDEGIRAREEAITLRKQELADSYESLVADIDDLLGKAAESSATMAERSFESKRRDFQRFLERAERNYAQVETDPEQAAALLQNFKSFVECWLLVFSECSIDPIHFPKRVVTHEELAQCKTIGAASNLVLERLKQTEVRFISTQRDMDAQDLHGFRVEARRLTKAPPRPSMLLCQKPRESRSASMEIELTPSSSWASKASLQPDCESELPLRRSSISSLREPAEPAAQSRRCSFCTWLQLGVCFPCRVSRPDGDRFPTVLSCVCMQMVLLSREHAALIISCFVITIAMVLMVPHENETWAFVLSALYLLCIFVLLVQFERIDVVRRLEREVVELQTKSDRVLERRERMVTFWNDMQDLTDIWVHRTVPRLDLLKELQSLLEVTEQEDLLPVLAGANRSLEALERALPELSCWRSEGGLSEAKKRAFAEKVLRLCQQDNIPKIVHALNSLVEEGIPRPSISNAHVV